MKRIITFIALLPFLYISCIVAPKSVYRLQTMLDDREKIWLHGKEYSRLTGKNTEVIITFDAVANNRVAFDVEILNNGFESIIVSPELFVSYYLDENKQQLTKNAQQNTINPENEILQIEKAISRENARYSEENGTKSLFSLFDLAVDVASIGTPKTECERREEEQLELEKHIQDQEDDNYHAKVKTNLSYKRDRWEYDALRKTTLLPDYSVSGKIVFPFIQNSHYLKIVFNEEGENMDIVFKVNKFDSN